MKNHNTFIKETFSDTRLQIRDEFKTNLLNELKNNRGEYGMAKAPSQLNLKQLSKQKSFLYAGGFALLLVLAVGIYAVDTRSENLARQVELEETVALPENLEGVLGIDEMRTLAINDAPTGSTIDAIEVELEEGVTVYKVRFSDGSFRLYDAKTGLAFVKVTDEVEQEETVPADFVAGITLQQARDIAQQRRAGKTIVKIELETENSIVVYSVRFSDEGRVDVNATDGSIVRVKDGKVEASSSQSATSSTDDSNKDSDDSVDSTDHEEEDTEDDGDKSGSDSSGSNSGSGSSNSGSGNSKDD